MYLWNLRNLGAQMNPNGNETAWPDAGVSLAANGCTLNIFANIISLARQARGDPIEMMEREVSSNNLCHGSACSRARVTVCRSKTSLISKCGCVRNFEVCAASSVAERVSQGLKSMRRARIRGFAPTKTVMILFSARASKIPIFSRIGLSCRPRPFGAR